MNEAGFAHRLASVGAVALLWELVARLVGSPVLPPPVVVVQALGALVADGVVFSNLGASLVSLGTGFGAAVAVGVSVGAAMGASPRVERLLEPYLQVGLASPMLIYVPVLLTIGGATRTTQAATVFLYAVFAVAAHVHAGVRGVDRTLVEMARSFGAGPVDVFRRIAWPNARPMMMTGLRVGMALAVKGMVNGEMLVASTGLGALIRVHGGRFEPAKVLALLLVIVVVAQAATTALRTLETRMAARVRHA